MNSLAKMSLVFLLFFISVNGVASPQFFSELIELNNKHYTLDIADTRQRKRQGLMHRQTLGNNAGMLFIYSKQGDYRIWMKNTLIPLTVLWLDEQARVIDKKILQPCRVEKCPVFAATKPSKYIIELHSSQFNLFHIGNKLPAILLRK